MLLGGPRDGRVFEVDEYLPTLRVPILKRVGVSLAELDPSATPELDVAEYRLRKLDEPQWEGHKEIHAVGEYVEPPLACGHSRDRGPFSVYRDTQVMFRSYLELPEYKHHMPVLCKTCGLMVAMRNEVNLLEEVAEWNRWRAKAMEELGRIVDEMESIAEYSRRPRESDEDD